MTLQELREKNAKLKSKYYEKKEELKNLLLKYSNDEKTADEFIKFIENSKKEKYNIGNLPLDLFFQSYFELIKKTQGNIYGLNEKLKISKYNKDGNYLFINLEPGDIVFGFNHEKNYGVFEKPKFYNENKITQMEKIVKKLEKLINR